METNKALKILTSILVVVVTATAYTLFHAIVVECGKTGFTGFHFGLCCGIIGYVFFTFLFVTASLESWPNRG